jgi:hypothetical protein
MLIVMETGIGGNFLISHGAPWHIRMAQDITQQKKLHESCNVTSDRFNMQFRLWHGSPNCKHKPAGDAHHFTFFHVPPSNQEPKIMGVDLCHKNVGRPRFTETPVIWYQPFVLLHNARFHSECYTSDKGSNKTCENNTIPPTNIQYLKIHVRKWIRPQNSQRYKNRI